MPTMLLMEIGMTNIASLCVDLPLILKLFSTMMRIYYSSRQLETLPELEMSEEMVNTIAASLCVTINNVLLMAQDMTLGNDSWLFFK
ncbi:hypothetical protein Gohar_024476, partial [Gossypium harknessii]|nr:hypothetical protein [Gossypium harknessii]